MVIRKSKTELSPSEGVDRRSWRRFHDTQNRGGPVKFECLKGLTVGGSECVRSSTEEASAINK